jgi:hypothetical protein
MAQEGTVQYTDKPPISSHTAQERADADVLAKQTGRLRLSATAARVDIKRSKKFVKKISKAAWLSILVHCGALTMH